MIWLYIGVYLFWNQNRCRLLYKISVTSSFLRLLRWMRVWVCIRGRVVCPVQSLSLSLLLACLYTCIRTYVCIVMHVRPQLWYARCSILDEGAACVPLSSRVTPGLCAGCPETGAATARFPRCAAWSCPPARALHRRRSAPSGQHWN